MATASTSVIIPAYNSHATIHRAVDSVLAQTVQPLEVLIIDDGSSSPIAECFKSPATNIRIIRQPNGGAASARNRGLDEARGRFIAFLDADDYWIPDKLEQHQHAFDSHPQLGLTFSRFFQQAPNERPALFTKRIRHFPDFDECRRYRGRDLFDVACCIWTGTVVVRKSVIGDQRFQSGLEPAEDREFWVRLLSRCEAMCLSVPLAVAVLEPDSLSRTNIERDCRNMLRVIDMARATLGWRGTWWWKRRTFRRWASEHLGLQNPAALKPAFWRLCYEPWSPEAVWIFLKSISLFRRPPQIAQPRQSN